MAAARQHLRADSARELVPGALRGYYLPGGQLGWVGHDGVMQAAAFDLGRLEIRGNPVPVLNGIALLGGVVPNLVFARSGTMIMQQAGLAVQVGVRRLVWVDRAGRRTPVDTAWSFRLPGSGNAGWSLSPDGSQLAIGLNSKSGDDIWIKRMPDGAASRLTFDTTSEVRPRWTPDGRSVLYVTNGTNVLRQRRADGTGETVTVLDAGKAVLEGQWSSDGRWLIARTGGENLRTGGRDIVGPGADESAAMLSPDGRWLAYQSDETGRSEVYLRPFPGSAEGKWQVSLEGGHSPLWAHGGRELFFVDAARKMVSVSVTVTVAGTGAPELGRRQALFPVGTDLYASDPEYYTPFDISPDDQRFLMAEAQHDPSGAQARYLLVENWPEEVKAVMAAAR